jgi:hypothetical protein
MLGLRGLEAAGATRRVSVDIVTGYILPNTCPDPQPVNIADGVPLPKDAIGKDLTFVATTKGVTGFACSTTAGDRSVPSGLVLSYAVSTSAPLLPPVGPPAPAPTNGTSGLVSSNSAGGASSSNVPVIAGVSVSVIILAILAGVGYYYYSSAKHMKEEEDRQRKQRAYDQGAAGIAGTGFDPQDLEGRVSVGGMELSQLQPPRP